MADKPALHGRDHRPGGADPIPTVASDAIQFDTYPQAGNWLYVEATDESAAGGSPGGYGIELFSHDDFAIRTSQQLYMQGVSGLFQFSDATAGAALELRTTAGRLLFNNTTGGATLGDVAVRAYGFDVDTTGAGTGNNISMQASAFAVQADTTTGTGTIVLNSDENLSLQSNTTNITLTAASGQVFVEGSTIVFDSLTQKATLTTLGDVIALLQSYGLAT